jgi:hypothetical protein
MQYMAPQCTEPQAHTHLSEPVVAVHDAQLANPAFSDRITLNIAQGKRLLKLWGLAKQQRRHLLNRPPKHAMNQRLFIAGTPSVHTTRRKCEVEVGGGIANEVEGDENGTFSMITHADEPA